MNVHFRLLLFLFAAIFTFGETIAGVWRDPKTGIEWSFTLHGDGASLGGGEISTPAISRSTKGNIVIPEIIDEHPVVEVDTFAFWGCSEITQIILPCGVTNIGMYAFSGCYTLSSISLPECLLQIGGGAFEECIALSNISLPQSLQNIGWNAFAGCINLKSFSISETNQYFTSIDGVLFDPSQKTLLLFPCGKCTEYIIPPYVISIGDFAFGGCRNLLSIIFSNGVYLVGNAAFNNCGGLTKITIPSCVTNIGYIAFDYCTNLDAIDFEGKPPTGLNNASIKSTAAIRYNIEYEAEWLPVVEECGFLNAKPYAPKPKQQNGTIMFLVSDSHFQPDDYTEMIPSTKNGVRGITDSTLARGQSLDPDAVDGIRNFLAEVNGLGLPA